ncbi:hypothetical protein SNK03_012683 [Fusarium graminearum]|uniref:Chromosome 3, complete genome n=2 Tax=Gibberella zeae TaxID=5518 RepID=I1S266_GIBZE|nr:hypothetical protein FGSG_10852 [Fusarium graminearum PH-1]EYB34111.1 hypothetical protein FG05_10852 [Fusarium graminearum]ESU17915.1 hypothetical protein FGSG_10852 [Fusarium graminearum PH-1]KAI6768776.1 hypothetical protein HG531_010965 [Fusarium graminearum]PCD36855.1 hypothetical protein FGRA07_07859 [Fusarium graminearum]CAF3482860.1 unnamed protein product [Fusarium graminearum]|eukprot:XP_011325537.1 hypothetical protein FGSG_10852 [Fusarium graminearum PH-1]
MHILLLSTSDQNGSAVLQSAISRNYTVTALLPYGSYSPSHANVILVTGSSTSQHDLETALQTPMFPEAIVIAFDHANLWELVARALLKAIAAVNLRKRTEWKSSYSQISLPFRLVFTHSNATQMGRDDYNRVDAIVRDSGLPFVLAPNSRVSKMPKTIRASPCDGRGVAWMAAVKRVSMATDTAQNNEPNGGVPGLVEAASIETS